ncbi:MAG: hypothetical protein KDA58_11045 [Planctomycetaceae bacterium]|nr:hypothetical protein [Planctomycetaceae bacterium]
MRKMLLLIAALVGTAMFTASAQADHFYRGSNCGRGGYGSYSYGRSYGYSSPRYYGGHSHYYGSGRYYGSGNYYGGYNRGYYGGSGFGVRTPNFGIYWR